MLYVHKASWIQAGHLANNWCYHSHSPKTLFLASSTECTPFFFRVAICYLISCLLYNILEVWFPPNIVYLLWFTIWFAYFFLIAESVEWHILKTVLSFFVATLGISWIYSRVFHLLCDEFVLQKTWRIWELASSPHFLTSDQLHLPIPICCLEHS